MVNIKTTMSECMQTDKIAVLMAVCEPNINWLYEQLCSINRQTYPNISLYLCDDGSDYEVYESIKECVTKCITNFHVTLIRNEKNMGSNATFERLTNIADGDYFAYSDQDDVWEKDKLSKLYECLINDNAVLSYGDMSVIDDKGNKLADSLKILRPRLEYLSGNNLSERYFFRNCTAGCSMLVKSEIAKKAVPFPEKTVCDQWLCIIAAIYGNISFCEKSLVRYRQHENNQTGVLTGVVDKQTYYERRLFPLKERMDSYNKVIKPTKELETFINARCERDVLNIWKFRKFSKFEAYFEIFMKFSPNWLVKFVLAILK